MPRTAHQSRACLNCRTRHLKCTEDRPACQACVRAGLICEYKEESDIIFRDQTLSIRQNVEKADQRHTRRKLKSRRVGSGSSSSNAERRGSVKNQSRQQNVDQDQSWSLESDAESLGVSHPAYEISSPYLALSENAASVALAVFFSRYCRQNRDPNGEQGMNNLLPSLYSKSKKNSAFQLSVSAFALGIVGRWPERPDWKELSVKRYFAAVSALKGTLIDPRQIYQDETLAAIMQIMAYEKLNLPHVPGSAMNHVQGLLSLLKARGVQACDTEVSQQLLSVARTHALAIYLSPKEELEQDEHIWVESLGDHSSNVSSGLVRIAAEVRTLRKLIKATKSIIQTNRGQLSQAVNEIINTALKIDDTLDTWPATIPRDWNPLPADLIPVSVQQAGVFRGMCTVYCNIWAANSWNKYRLARIAVHTVILDQVQRLAESEHKYQLIKRSLRVLQDETNGICSSVPFYLGSRDTFRTTDQPFIEFPSHSAMPLTEETREHLITLGEWFLFWPFSRMLHNLDVVAGLYPQSIDAEQMAWIRGQVIRNGRRAATRSSLANNI